MIDLHIHSTASDGTLSPCEIIKMASGIGLKAVALTDHDTSNGLEEFLSSAKDTAVSAIPGVEIAGAWNHRELHILGFWIDYRNKELGSLMDNARSNRTILKAMKLLKMSLPQNLGVKLSAGHI